MYEETNNNEPEHKPAVKKAGSSTGRSAVVVGVVAGVIFGGLFFGAYGAISAWLCTGNVNCPQRWEPYAITSAIAWGVGIVVSGFSGWLLYRIYRLFSVD